MESKDHDITVDPYPAIEQDEDEAEVNQQRTVGHCPYHGLVGEERTKQGKAGPVA